MFVLDSHCDTPSQIMRLRDMSIDNEYAHVDFPKLKRGGVDGAFFALYVPASLNGYAAEEYAWKLLDGVRKSVSQNSDKAAFACSLSEAMANKAENKFSVFLGLENGSPLVSPEKVEEFYDAGVRYVTLCHSADNIICDSCASSQKTWGGLSPYGREVVHLMNEIGMAVDVSHISDESFYDVLETSSKPVLATHSCCRALAAHPRNLSDEMICRLADKGGLVQINFYPVFLDSGFNSILESSGLLEYGFQIEQDFIACPSDMVKRIAWYSVVEKLQSLPRPSYKRVVDHIDHAVAIAGIDHVGIGSDFDGIEVTPEGLEDISKIQIVFDEMRARGYSEDDIKKVSGGNLLRFLDKI